MKRLRELEAQLVRLEGAALVLIVTLMLGLAGYNVIYRNVLVPLQVRWAHSGPIPEEPAKDADPAPPDPAPESKAAKKPRKPKAAGDFGGAFGEGRGESGDAFDEFDEAPGDAAKEAGDKAGGFGGAFGGGRPDELDELDEPPEPEPEAKPAADDGFRGAFGAAPVEEDEADDFGDDGDGGDDPSDDGESFGGAFGKPAASKASDAADDGSLDGEEEADDFGDDDVFENLEEIEAADPEVDAGPQGGPPPPGSFAANMVELIDAVKLDWIDVLLRQLVIIMSFLGGALATARRKHINVDAASKLLPAGARRLAGVATNLLAISVCLTLANSGKRLVEIGREYPKEITPFATDWMFQLMFPIGFGLLAVHFGVRLLEELTGTAPPPPEEAAAAAEAPPAPQADGAGEDEAASDAGASEEQGERSTTSSDDETAQGREEDNNAETDTRDEPPDDPQEDPDETGEANAKEMTR